MVFVKVVFNFCFCPCGCGVFDGVKITKVNGFPIDPDMRYPLRLLLIPRHTHNAACVVAWQLPVFVVLLICSVAQVHYAIIRPLTINMINLICGPRVVVNCPSNAMGAQMAVKDFHINVPAAPNAPRRFSAVAVVPPFAFAFGFEKRHIPKPPEQIAGLGLVSQKLSQGLN